MNVKIKRLAKKNIRLFQNQEHIGFLSRIFFVFPNERNVLSFIIIILIICLLTVTHYNEWAKSLYLIRIRINNMIKFTFTEANMNN